jgi:hypothetical protein
MTPTARPGCPHAIRQRLQVLQRHSDALRWRLQWQASALGHSVWAPWAARAGLFALRQALRPPQAQRPQPLEPWGQLLLREALGWLPLGLRWLAPALAQAAWRRWRARRSS